MCSNLPVPEQVMYASRYSPLPSLSPKQMLVVSRSPVAMWCMLPSAGEITVTPPLISVATQTLPSPSTASESSS